MEAISLDGGLSRLVDAQYRIDEAPPLVEEVLSVVLDTVLSLIGGRPVIALLDGDRLVVRGAVKADGPQVGHAVGVPGTVCELALRAREALLCRDLYQRDHGDIGVRDLAGVRSSVAVALRHGDRTLGVLACTAPAVAAFDEQDRDRLSLLARVTSSALATALAREWELSADATSARVTLAGTEHLLSEAMLLTGLAAWEWDVASGRLTWSPQMFELVGLEPGAIEPTIGEWRGFLHPEDRERCALERHGARLAGRGYSEVFRVVTADGLVRYLRGWSQPRLGAGGDVVTIYGAALDVTDEMTVQRELSRLAATDPVTGLANRKALDVALGDLLTEGAASLAVLLIDLDRFKNVNDTLGHHVGDQLLVEVARRLGSNAPSDSLVVRMGGDEFVVLLRHHDGLDHVTEVAAHLVQTLRAPYPLTDSAVPMSCTISLGVALPSVRTRNAGDLMREADLALYRAKDDGRDRFVIFDEELRQRAVKRRDGEQRLRRALHRDEVGEAGLHLAYQPIVDLDSGSVVGVEALVRLHDPVAGELLPDSFIDVAEDTGLIVDVDARVVQQALRGIRGTNRTMSMAGRPWVAVNVSARSLETPGLVSLIDEAMTRLGVPASCLRVELTERTLLSPTPSTDLQLDGLRDLGVALGVDDFGTGYSALAYLQHLDLAFMKIDRSFVAPLGQDGRSRAVVKAIIDLAHAHDMVVTAEGVENAEQADRLRQMGCDQAQGWFFGRPGDLDLALVAR